MKLKTKKHVREQNPCEKFGKDRFTGCACANTQILAVHLGYPFIFLYSSLRVPVAPRVVQQPMRVQNACFRTRQEIVICIQCILSASVCAFLSLLVGQQEGRPACKSSATTILKSLLLGPS